MFRSPVFNLILALASLSCVALAVAEENGEPTLQWRRIFVPADRINEMPGRLHPRDIEEFQALLQASRIYEGKAPATGRATITSARYEGRLIDDVLEGTATLKVDYDQEKPTLLRIGPLSLAVSDARWIGSNEPEDAQLGWTSEGDTVLYVEKSGTLQFAWTVRGDRQSTSTVDFDLQLPGGINRELMLELGERLLPETEDGVVRLVEADDDSDTQLKHWQVIPGPGPRIKIEVRSQRRGEARAEATWLRQADTYELTTRGVELRTELQLDVLDDPLHELKLRLGNGLQLLSAEIGQEPLDFEIALSAEGEERVALLRFPEPVSGYDQVISLVAVARLQPDQLWQLPAIRVDEITWSQQSTRLLLAEPLELAKLSAEGARLVHVEPLSMPQEGEEFTLQHDSDEARLEVAIRAATSLPGWNAVTLVEVAPNQVTGEATLHLEAADEGPFRFECRLAPDWVIDSVNTSPREMLLDWNISGSAGSQQRLAVRLRRPLSTENIERLTIAGRAPGSGQNIEIGNCRMVSGINEGEIERDLINVRAAADHRLLLDDRGTVAKLGQETVGSGMPDSLQPEATEELGPWFEADANGTLTLLGRQPRFSAKVESRVDVGPATIDEKVTVRVDSRSADLQTLLVHVVPASNEPWNWYVEGEPGSLATAERLAPAEADSAAAAGGEIWRLALKRPRNRPLAIVGERSRPLSETASPALVALPEANNQSGTLLVRGLPGSHFALEAKQLEAMPPPGKGDLNPQAMFRYDPVQHVLVENSSPVQLVTDEATADMPAAVIRRSLLSTQYVSDGLARHTLALLIESTGGRRIAIRLPEESTIRSAKVNDSDLSVLENAADLQVDLSPQGALTTVVIDFDQDVQQLGLVGELQPPTWSANVPVLRKRWQLYVPPGVEATNVDATSIGDKASLRSPSWRRRIFGPLARSDQDPAFDPFERQQWRKLVGDLRLLLREGHELSEENSDRSNETLGPANVAGWATAAKIAEPGPGWKRYTIDTVESGEPVHLVNRTTITNLAWALFLLVMLLVPWIIRKASFLAVVPIVGAVVALALIVDPAWLPFCWAAFWGTFAGIAAYSHYRVKIEQPTGPRRGSSLRQPVPALLLLSATLVIAATAIAQDAVREDRNAKAAKIHPVYVPLDEDSKPDSEQVYISEKFYQELTRREEAVRQLPRNCMITKANYTATIAPRPPDDSAILETLRATYTVWVYQLDCELRVPFAADGFTIPEDGVRLDGIVVPLARDAQGDLLVTIDQPGEYELTVDLEPAAGEEPAAGLDLHIPSVPDSKLEASAVPGFAVTVPTCRGRVTNLGVGDRLTADLGALGRLQLAWSPRPAASQLDVDTLVWLRVQPATVNVTARFHVVAGSEIARRLTLETEPQLRLLPLAEDGPVKRIETIRDSKKAQHILEIEEGIESFSLEARFLWRDRTGVGRLRVPSLQLADVNEQDRKVAVTVDPALSLSADTSESVSALAVPDFIRSWGEADDDPAQAYQLSTPQDACRLKLNLRSPSIVADQTHRFSIGGQRIKVECVALVELSGTFVSQHHLTVPAQMAVEKVVVEYEGANRVYRWSHNPGGLIDVLLSDPISGQHTVRVFGEIPVPASGKLPLEFVTLQRRVSGANRLELYRQPEVDVAIRNATGLEAVETASIATRADLGRHVETYRVGEQATATIRVRSNQPKFSAQQLVILSKGPGGWEAAAEFAVNVERDKLDHLRLELSPQWQAPRKVTPASSSSIREIPGEESRLLEIRPRGAIADAYRFRVDGPIQFASGERISPPRVRLMGTRGVEHYLLLPRQIDLQQIRWETSGLEPVGIPDALLPADIIPEAFSSFQVVRPNWTAKMASVERSAAIARVLLHDIAVSWQGGDRYQGRSVLHLEPGGLQKCLLEFQAGQRPLQVLINGAAVPCHKVHEDRWQLTLQSATLPQPIEVVFDAPLSPEATKFTAPRLLAESKAVPVEQTLWSASTSVPVAVREAESLTSIDERKASLVRMESALAATDSLLENLGTSPLTDIQQCFTPWANRLARAYRDLASQTDQSPENEILAQAKELLRDVDAVAERLGVSEAWRNAMQRAASKMPVQQVSLTAPRGERVYYVGGGNLTQLVVVRSQADRAGNVVRWLSALLVALAVVPLMRVGHTAAAKDLPWRWPMVIAAFIGLAWWLWLRASIVGIVLLAICVLALFMRRPGRPLRVSPSGFRS